MFDIILVQTLLSRISVCVALSACRESCNTSTLDSSDDALKRFATSEFYALIAIQTTQFLVYWLFYPILTVLEALQENCAATKTEPLLNPFFTHLFGRFELSTLDSCLNVQFSYSQIT